MNKTEVINEVAKRTGISKEDTRSVINGMTEYVQDQLLRGIDVKLTGFINFTLTVSPEHTKKSPQTGKEIIVPKKYRVKTTLPVEFVKKVKAKTVY